MPKKNKVRRYPLKSSPLYRIGRHVDLAAILGINRKKMRRLIVQRSALYRFSTITIGEKTRSLAVPTGDMRDLHERLKVLLSRIEIGDYMFSPKAGMSPIDNAELHSSGNIFLKMDVKQFYPSTTDEHVFQFFRYRMEMPDDIAGRITKLCTINDALPFGSPLSPILCALVHDDIFSQSASECSKSGNNISLWVDDLVVSGRNPTKDALKHTKRLLSGKGLVCHKEFRTSARQGAIITGTYVDNRGISPTNKAHKKMRDGLRALNEGNKSEILPRQIQSMIGQTNHFMQIYRSNPEMVNRLRSRLSWLHGLRRQVDRLPQLRAVAPASMIDSDDETAPW